MSIHLPLRRTGLTSAASTTKTTTFICTQCRHATLLRRPKRPYTFTQLVTLSDGSTFTHRTTSPMPVYRSTRDTRNSLLWNPSSNKLMNVEEDEAGRLAAFRAKFGRGYDAAPAPGAAESSSTSASAKEEDKKQEASARKDKKTKQEDDSTAPDDYYDEDEDDNLLDLISSFGQEQEAASSSSSGKKKK